MSDVIGGGAKKVLYTLDTVRRIGLRNSSKALKAKNTCKACGLGMGGQLGGMTNEKKEFPSVCNKSIQAQSTDIQAPIPPEVFEHSIRELKQLSSKDVEHMGRLNLPLFKAKNSQYFSPISWEAALEHAANTLRDSSPEKSFFYSSGRSSNEAGFVMQLFARLYGTNNINNCSYYCHQATGVGLKSTIGTGTSTIELEDLAQCDLLFLIGANPASNHPRLVHQLKNIRDRGGDVVAINPAKEPGLVKFALPKSPKSMLKGGDLIASYYLQPNIASDLWVFKGIAKFILEQHAEDIDFINNYTDGFEAFKNDLSQTQWTDILQSTGLSKLEIETIASVYAKGKNVVFAWGMGITHHLTGSKNVEYIANLALLRGMIGKKYAGLLPLRGHSNIQGVGTIGVKPVLAEDVISALEAHLNVKLPSNKGMDTLACLDAADRGEIDNAFIMGGNLYEASPDAHWAEQALDKIKCKIFLTTTLNKGHLHGNDASESLILPVTARDEESQPTTQESMFNYVRMSEGGINRLDNLKPETEAIIDIASKIIPKSTFDFSSLKSHQSIRHAIAACIPGMQALKDIDVAKKEFHVQKRIIHRPEFHTKTKRAQFITHPLEVTQKNTDKPFKLMTIRSEGQFNSIIYEENDSYRSVTNRWTILMNADDLDTLGLQEGSYVNVRSNTGEMKSLRAQAFDLPRGNVMTYYPEANILVGRDVDPRSKTPSFKCVEVSIEASKERIA